MTGTVVVSQLGARMHYAVPRIFAEHGLLAHFYTDICATKGLPRLVNALPQGVMPAAVRRLAGRQPKGVPPTLTSVFSGFGARSAVKRMRCRDVVDETAHAVWAGAAFSNKVAKSGFHDASVLYAFSGDALEQMLAARRQGLRTVVEQMIAPRTVVETLIEHEKQCFPDWVLEQRENPHARRFAEREIAEWQLADLILCPSEFVSRHVQACGGPVEKCVVVPYGVDAPMAPLRTFRPAGELRVLTVGEVGLRKGSPYVVEAARRTCGRATFRMAGHPQIPANIKADISRWVELRGIVPRNRIAQELDWADIFLLPSLCEGSATAVYEALAAGLPVITTENTGSVVRDGVEGFIVATGDSEAIARAVDKLAGDRDLLMAMSAKARLRAAEFTVKAYGQRLMDALATLDPGDAASVVPFKMPGDHQGQRLQSR